MRLIPVRLRLTLVLALLVPGGIAPRAVAAPHARLSTVQREVFTGIGACAAVAGLATADRSLRDELRNAGGAGGERVSDLATPLGTPVVLAPALLLWAASGYFDGRPDRIRSSVRIGVDVSAAVVACEAIKLGVGRERPYESPGDARVFHPFSHHDSFPSGHTTFAFATAAALSREAPARWVPWVAFPVAGAVGWSRVRDDRHWASDALAGAILGTWVARAADACQRSHPGMLRRLHLAALPAPGGVRVTALRTF